MKIPRPEVRPIPVAQTFQSAVSRVFQPASSGRSIGKSARADWKVGDTAGWKTCATDASRRRYAMGRSSAFSLLEIMVAVGLLAVIIVGLLAMFYQTERAFRAGITQVDVLEAGRAAVQQMARELREMKPSDLTNVVNYYADIPIDGILQPMPNRFLRTNRLQDFFFLTRPNLDGWKGISYGFDTNDGVATLQRMEVPESITRADQLSLFLSNNPVNVRPINTNFHRFADGVVHLEVRAYDRLGNLVLESAGTNVPALIELELGILEPKIAERARALGAGARNFLEYRAGRVHLFRERIPIRTAP